MHFYTFDEWLANAYYSHDDSIVSRGSSTIINWSSQFSGKPCLNVRSCWKNPKFVSTVGTNPIIVPKMEPINCDIGALYQFKDRTRYNDYVNYNLDPYDFPANVNPSGYRANRGCVQVLDKNYGSYDSFPFIQIAYRGDNQEPQQYYEQDQGYNKEILRINLSAFDSFERILVFQSLQSGAISYEDANTCLELWFSSTPMKLDYKTYDYRLSTNAHSSNSLMIAAALLTFDNVNGQKYLIVDNLSDFAWGQPNLDSQYDWNVLWEAVNSFSA